MFSKHKSSATLPAESGRTPVPGQGPTFSAMAASLVSNPISAYYDIGKEMGSAGPELAWKLFEAYRKADNKEVCIWFFDRKWVEKFGKSSKRIDYVMETLKRGAIQLDRHRHAKILTIYNQLIETSDTLAFATEPILGSLANILGYLEDRLRQGVPSSLREHTFDNFEVKYGLLQITEALGFLHFTCKTVHKNICPQSIIVNKFGTWKLAGLEFIEKGSDNDPLLPISAMAYTTKCPKMAQIDLDFTAPEIQASNACSPQSDMFSLGLLTCSIFNNGRSPIQAALNPTIYTKQLESLSKTVLEITERMPAELAVNILCLTEPAPRKRLTSVQFATIEYFVDEGVRALQNLDMISMKDNAYKANFYQNLRTAMSSIPKKLWFHHMLPQISNELQCSEISASALQPVLQMIEDCTLDEYQNFIFPLIQNIYQVPKSVQATVTLLENIDILVRKTGERHIKSEILPMLISGLDSTTPQIQCAALSAITEVVDHLDEKTIRKTVLPRAQTLLSSNDSIHLQKNVLTLIEKVINNLEKNEILDEILPLLLSSKLSESIVLSPALSIYNQLLSDKRFGLNVNILATKVMPSLIPAIVSPNLTIEDFNTLADLLQNMLNLINKNQRNKLKMEKMSSYSIEKYSMQHNMDQPIGYPHRPPCLKLQTRRQSISVDNVQKPNINSNCSSPDLNYLKVNCNLPFRRHSDNAIEPPRILINNTHNSSSNCYIPTAPYGISNGSNLSINSNLIPKRRHSSVSPQEVKGFSANNFINIAKNFAKNSCTGSGSALNSLNFNVPGRSSPVRTCSPSSRLAGSSRRYSTTSIFNQSPTTSSNILNQLGTGMQQFFGR